MSTAIDVSKIPTLARLVEEVEKTKKPRELKRADKIVAVLTPVISDSDTKEKWREIKATFGSWKDINAPELIANISHWKEDGSRPATNLMKFFGSWKDVDTERLKEDIYTDRTRNANNPTIHL